MKKRYPKSKKVFSFFFALGAFVLIGTGNASAATITVTANAVDETTNANCSLFEAIESANTDAAVDGCVSGSGADTINVPNGTYDLGANSVSPTLTSDIVLSGQSSTNTIFTGGGSYGLRFQDTGTPPTVSVTNILFQSASIESTGNDANIEIDNIVMEGTESYLRVYPVTDGTEFGTASLSNSVFRNVTTTNNTITMNGFLSVSVENVQVHGTASAGFVLLELSNLATTVTDLNIYDSDGGVNMSGGTVSVSDTVVRGNTNFTWGVFNGNSTATSDLEAVFNNVAVINNSGYFGFALGVDGGTSLDIDMKNTTIAGNDVQASAVYFNVRDNVPVTGDMQNVTIANNILSSNDAVGLGYFSSAGTVPSINLRNVLLANNAQASSVRNCAPDGWIGVGLELVSAGNNLSDDTSCTSTLNQPSDKNNTAAQTGAVVEMNNTWVVPLTASSPAIDTGATILSITSDQRGVARPQGSAYDIGAYESDAANDVGAGNSESAESNSLAETGVSVVLTTALAMFIIGLPAYLFKQSAYSKIIYRIK